LITLILQHVHTISVLATQILFDLAFQAAIPVVPNGIITPAMQGFGDITPVVSSALLLEFKDDAVLMLRPSLLGDMWVKLIMPSIPTLHIYPSCDGKVCFQLVTSLCLVAAQFNRKE
jgi:hypothetical protein